MREYKCKNYRDCKECNNCPKTKAEKLYKVCYKPLNSRKYI